MANSNVVCQVNPSVLGGLVVDFGEKTIDLSVSSRINKLNNLLSRTSLLIQHPYVLILYFRVGLVGLYKGWSFIVDASYNDILVHAFRSYTESI